MGRLDQGVERSETHKVAEAGRKWREIAMLLSKIPPPILPTPHEHTHTPPFPPPPRNSRLGYMTCKMSEVIEFEYVSCFSFFLSHILSGAKLDPRC